MKIETERFLLRPWQTGDEAALVKHANNKKIWLNLRDSFPHPYTPEDARTWVQIANDDPNILNLAIVFNGEVVGGMGLALKDDIYYRSAEIGYWLGEAFWNKGIATEATKALMRFAFQHYDICRVYAGVFAYNKASMRVLEKAGFTQGAILKKAVTKNKQTVDEYIFAVVI